MIAWYLSRPAFQAQMTLCIGPGGSRHWLVRFIVMIWCLKCVCLTFTLCTGSQRPSLCPKTTCSDLLFSLAQFYHRWYTGPSFFIFVPFERKSHVSGCASGGPVLPLLVCWVHTCSPQTHSNSKQIVCWPAAHGGGGHFRIQTLPCGLLVA